jgi:hypothetical protein
MSNLYREHSIDASYQVSVHLAKRFQRRRLKCEKLTDDRRRTPSDGKSSHCLWQGELKKINYVKKKYVNESFSTRYMDWCKYAWIKIFYNIPISQVIKLIFKFVQFEINISQNHAKKCQTNSISIDPVFPENFVFYKYRT